MGPSRAGVVQKLIVRVNNPETGWVDVRVEKRVGHPCEHSQIVLDGVVHLHPIFEEECQSLDVVGNIVLYNHVRYVVEGASSVVRVVDGISTDVASAHVSRNVKVNRVPL